MNKSLGVATFAYVVNEDNKVLLLRRAKNDTFPGKWEFPGGGLEYGEDPKESIEREVYEEAGIHVRAIKPMAVVTHSSHDENISIVRITYECKLVDSAYEVKLSHEHDAFQWVDESELLIGSNNNIVTNILKELQNITSLSAV